MAAQRPMITHPGRLQAEVALKQLAMAPALFNFILTPMAAALPADRKRASSGRATRRWPRSTEWTQVDERQRGELADQLRDGRGRIQRDAARRTAARRTTPTRLPRSVRRHSMQRSRKSARFKAQAKAKGVNLSNPVQAAANGGGMTPTTKDAQFAFFQAQLDTLRAFIARKRIVTIPDYVGRMKIVETPPFLQPILAGAVDESAAAALEPGRRRLLRAAAESKHGQGGGEAAPSSKISIATAC